MSEWHSVTLGQITTQRKGINYKSEDYGDQHSGHPFLTIKCFVKGGGYEPMGIKFYDGFSTKPDHLRAGDILFSVTDLTRAGDIVGSPLKVPDFGGDKPALASMDCMRIEPIVEECDKDFLFHRLMLPDVHRKMVAYSAGSTVLHLDTKKVPTISIRIPMSTREQKKIAAILTNIDKAIEKTEALIAKHQQIKAGLMHDLFTRGVTADGKLRPSREQAPELYQETPIGWIPKSWDASGLKARAVPGIPHLRTGPFGSSLKGEHWVNEGHPVITIGALGEGTFIESELLYVSDADANRLKDFQLKEGEVVFSRVADVGRSIVIREEQIGWIMSSNLMRISLDRKRVIPEILQQQLAFDDRLKRQIKAKVNSGGRDVANSEILNQLLFVWPTYDEQELMVERAAAIDCQLRAEEDRLGKLQQQKFGLMSDLLTGEVRVQPESKTPEMAGG